MLIEKEKDKYNRNKKNDKNANNQNKLMTEKR
jgi:hypothetical protein